MSYDAKKFWNKAILGTEMAYPAEYVIRIFKGNYPRLNLPQGSFKNKKICDVGCGDGRNLVLLKQCGFDIYGTEITPEIVDRVKTNLQGAGIQQSGIRVGANDSIPFKDNLFDYLLSWNSCYYMGKIEDFNLFIQEFARVLKKKGRLILSIPKKTCFIFHGAKRLRNGYCIIRKDPFEIRNGEIFRVFKDKEEIKKSFSDYFEDFIFGSVQDDCFGFDYHWHLVICRKK